MFTVDTIVRPLPTADSEYSVCGNSVLHEAKVTKVFPLNAAGNNMTIEILAHDNPDQIGKKYKVNSAYFEAIPQDWIWVDAYKGTDANMCCLGKRYTMGVEDTYGDDVVLGSKGYHVCTDLKHCFKNYDYDFHNRFFKVQALVNANDYQYRNPNNTTLVAKAIRFVEEITYSEAITAKRESMQ